jgi:hypothetical protein
LAPVLACGDGHVGVCMCVCVCVCMCEYVCMYVCACVCFHPMYNVIVKDVQHAHIVLTSMFDESFL